MGDYDEAIRMLGLRNFHIYEGGEGKVTKQSGWAHLLRAWKRLADGKHEAAIEDLRAALVIPPNFGEGRNYFAQEAHIHFNLGAAHERMGDATAARDFYRKAAEEGHGVTEITYYQGKALRKLGREAEARDKFKALAGTGEDFLRRDGTPGYFGVGMAIPLPFGGDVRNNNRITGFFLRGLGRLGLGEAEAASVDFDALRGEDPHYAPLEYMLSLGCLGCGEG
ncbi:MAG: hypothetical protein PHV34_17480 [Verrucomicrobiae bacterium]|nr:hypothetical protein [Verrucomicrobiae bacterium]